METYAFSNAMIEPMKTKPIKAKHMNFSRKTYRYILSLTAALWLATAQPLPAQSDNRVTVPLTDPARPVTLRAHLVSGSITVKGADVKEVVVEAKARGGEESHSGGRAEG